MGSADLRRGAGCGDGVTGRRAGARGEAAGAAGLAAAALVGAGRDSRSGRRAGACGVGFSCVRARWSSSRCTSRSCSSDNSTLVPHCQQSATSSQMRIDIGAPQSGHGHINTSPSSQIEPSAVASAELASLVAGGTTAATGDTGGGFAAGERATSESTNATAADDTPAPESNPSSSASRSPSKCKSESRCAAVVMDTV